MGKSSRKSVTMPNVRPQRWRGFSAAAIGVFESVKSLLDTGKAAPSFPGRKPGAKLQKRLSLGTK